MSNFSEVLRNLTITAYSTDGTIQGALLGKRSVRFRFISPYGSHQDSALSIQLSGLVTSLFDRHKTKVRSLADEAGLNLLSDPSMAINTDHREYLRQVRELKVGLYSRQELILVQTVGLEKMNYILGEGVVKYLCENEFLDELTDVTNALISEFHNKSIMAREAIYRPDSS